MQEPVSLILIRRIGTVGIHGFPQPSGSGAVLYGAMSFKSLSRGTRHLPGPCIDATFGTMR